MLRTSLLQSARAWTRTSPRAVTLTATRTMAEGATGAGAARAGGSAQGDAFTKREKANEDYYVKQKEREKLAALKAKLQQQRAHLDELDKHIDEMTADDEQKSK